MSWYLYSYKPLIKKKLLVRKYLFIVIIIIIIIIIIPLFTLGSIIALMLVGPSKYLKQIIQLELNRVKNPNWPEANQLQSWTKLLRKLHTWGAFFLNFVADGFGNSFVALGSAH